jgi:hypothetical protein
MHGRQAIGSTSGQGTVEWVGLLTLLFALFVALGAAGFRTPGAGLAAAIVNRIQCALGERSLCGPSSPQPALARVYGAELAAEVRAHAPEVDYESGMTALPVDFRSCRGPVCGNGPSSGAVWLSDTGSRAVSFVHVVDCRPGRPHLIHRPAICSGPLRGNLYIQYWLYYEDSSSLKDLQPILDPLGAGAFHQDDWESYQVRIGADGEVASRASSHNSYNYDGGITAWPSDAGLFPRSAWGPCTGRTYVSGGSHAGHVHEGGDPPESGGRRHGDAPLPPSDGRPPRWTPADHLELIPIETLAPRVRRTRFAIVPPWKKVVFFYPEWRMT